MPTQRQRPRRSASQSAARQSAQHVAKPSLPPPPQLLPRQRHPTTHRTSTPAYCLQTRASARVLLTVRLHRVRVSPSTSLRSLRQSSPS